MRGFGSPAGRATARPLSDLIDCGAMNNDMTKRLIWSGLLAGIGALASIATTRLAALVWRQVFHEDPPE